MFCFFFLLLVPSLGLLFYALAARLLGPSPKTVSDLILVLRPVSLMELEDLFDEVKERNLRSLALTPQLRDSQRTRSRLLFEYLRRMSFNTLALLVWAYAEEERIHGPGMPPDEAQSQYLREMIEAGAESRSYCVFALFNLAWRILLGRCRAARSANLAAVRHVGGIDGPEAYRHLAQAAIHLSAAQGNRNTRHLAALLLGSDSAS